MVSITCRVPIISVFLLLSPSLFCLPHYELMNQRQDVEARNTTLFTKLADREADRLMSENKHLLRSEGSSVKWLRLKDKRFHSVIFTNISKSPAIASLLNLKKMNKIIFTLRLKMAYAVTKLLKHCIPFLLIFHKIPIRKPIVYPFYRRVSWLSKDP